MKPEVTDEPIALLAMGFLFLRIDMISEYTNRLIKKVVTAVTVVAFVCVQYPCTYGLPLPEEALTEDAKIHYIDPYTITVNPEGAAATNYIAFTVGGRQSVIITLPLWYSQVLSSAISAQQPRLVGEVNREGIFILINRANPIIN